MALEKISSEDVLESVFNHAAQDVRKTALERSLGLEGGVVSLVVCHAVLRRHTDQGFFARVVDSYLIDFHGPLSELRACAVRKLTDQALLNRIATTDRSSEVRAAAVGYLTDQAALAKVAQSDKGPTVGKAAVEKLTDQAALAEIAYGRATKEAQEAAVRKLTDQTLLAKIAESTVSYVHVRVAVVRKLTDHRVLAELARTADIDDVRVAAAEKLTELTEDNFTRWKYSSEPQVWVSAHLEGWNHGDWVQLLAVLRNSQYWPMEEAAIGQHLEMLREQALTESQPSLSPPPAPGLPGVDMDRVERECILLLISARAWGEARGFDATWMEHSPPYQQLRDLGKSVSDAAGLEGIATVILAVRRSYRYVYLLDHFWDGIGEWRA